MSRCLISNTVDVDSALGPWRHSVQLTWVLSGYVVGDHTKCWTGILFPCLLVQWLLGYRPLMFNQRMSHWRIRHWFNVWLGKDLVFNKILSPNPEKKPCLSKKMKLLTITLDSNERKTLPAGWELSWIMEKYFRF